MVHVSTSNGRVCIADEGRDESLSAGTVTCTRIDIEAVIFNAMILRNRMECKELRIAL
jgi:hypothetical protein